MAKEIRKLPARQVSSATSAKIRFDYRLENDPRFLRRIEEARNDLRAGRGVRLEDVEPER